MSKKKIYKKIYKHYYKQTIDLFKNQKLNTSILDLFINQLKLIQAMGLLYLNNEDDLRLLTLTTALDYYSKYQWTIDILQYAAKKENKGQLDLDLYKKASLAYWDQFWELVQINLQEWLTLNAYLV